MKKHQVPNAGEQKPEKKTQRKTKNRWQSFFGFSSFCKEWKTTQVDASSLSSEKWEKKQTSPKVTQFIKSGSVSGKCKLAWIFPDAEEPQLASLFLQQKTHLSCQKSNCFLKSLYKNGSIGFIKAATKFTDGHTKILLDSVLSLSYIILYVL